VHSRTVAPHTIFAHTGSVHALTSARNGHAALLVSGGAGGEVRIWLCTDDRMFVPVAVTANTTVDDNVRVWSLCFVDDHLCIESDTRYIVSAYLIAYGRAGGGAQ
jgi:hypothetical protein